MVELRGWLASQGVERDPGMAPNKGGTVDVDGVKFTLTDANHSSQRTERLEYLGEPAGIVIELEDGFSIYFAGDTNVFMAMQLIGRIYEPDVAVLPIGDHYTMGPREAAVALELLGAKRCVPCHYGTFPLLTGTPDELRSARPGRVEILAHRARRDGRAVRERWLGATGRPGARDRRRRRAGAARRRALAGGARTRRPCMRPTRPDGPSPRTPTRPRA